jgi:hypothetical protein
MENGFLIESKSLTPEQAQMLLSILNNAQIRIGACADVMTAIISLQRIANNIDYVAAKTEEGQK